MTSEILNKTYNSVSEEIDALNIPLSRKIVSWTICLLSAALIVAGPIALCVNLFIFNDYQRLFLFFIGLLIILFVFLADFFHLRTITKGQITGLYHIWSMDVLILSFVVFAVLFIIIELGVF